MKNNLKILTVLLSITLLANAGFAAPFRADARTKRIPAGTRLKIQLIDPITTPSSKTGDYFSATLLDDQKEDSGVILPAGSILRGSLNKVHPARMLSRGAIVYMDFDHVVTPSGRQLPLTLSVCNRNDLTLDGGIFGSRGYGEAIQKNWHKTVEITQNATQFGIEAGENSFTGAVYLTTPLCAIGGAFGGGAYFLGDSVIDLFRKGNQVILNQGSVIEVMLIYPVDVPVN